MKRKAILIFNDGGPENYLPGVSIDKSNYLNFLKSPEGGAWDDSEICVKDNSGLPAKFCGSYPKTHLTVFQLNPKIFRKSNNTNSRA